MLRVTAWTVGLFGAGAAIAHAYEARWLEPIVLLALGLAFLFVSARVGRPAPAKLPARALAPRTPGAAHVAAPARVATAPAAATSAARVPVEQSASM